MPNDLILPGISFAFFAHDTWRNKINFGKHPQCMNDARACLQDPALFDGIGENWITRPIFEYLIRLQPPAAQHDASLHDRLLNARAEVRVGVRNE